MKLIYSISTLLLSTFVLSQVGVNTENPTRTLHIEGNLRIADLEDKSNDSDYSNVLIADENGNVDHIDRKDLLPKFDDGITKEVINSIYTNTSQSGKPENLVTCGKFIFNFNSNNDSDISFRLAEKPANNVRIFVSMEQNYVYNGNPGFQFFQGLSRSTAATNAFEFTATTNQNPTLIPVTSTSNWNMFRSFAEAALQLQEQNVFYFQYPQDEYFYRLTVYKVSNKINETNSYDFVIACEKF